MKKQPAMTHHAVRSLSIRSLDPALKSSRRRSRWGAMFAVLLLLVTGGLALGKDEPAGGGDIAQADAEKVPADAQPIGETVIVKLIPDQKTFLGSPPTVIDLSKLFAETKITKKPGELRIEIATNKKAKVADAQIDGQKLTLVWKEIGKTEITIRVTNIKTGDQLLNRFSAEVWEANYWKLLFTVVGGLGIFLLGMKNMSEGLQAIAGNGLRRMISLVTNNRLMAVGVGTVVTMLVQSSSITTVMVVGFVNSGFMTLSQAVGVIMGANIGTTVTGWVLALEIGAYGLPILGVAAFVYLFSRSDRVRFFAMAIMGLGMVFLGLEIMKSGFSMVKDLPEFDAWFKTFTADTYIGILKCAAVGCVLTFLVQSSSATLGITIGLAQIGVIEFETAAALVMGENIGTTITAWLASFGATTNARRAAYFHVIFNVVGVLWITALFPWYIPALEWVVAFVCGIFGWEANVTAMIAGAHSGFNVTNTLMFIPLAPALSRMLVRIVPDRDSKETPHLTNLDVRMLETPVIAIEQSRVEILRMADGCDKMMGWVKQIVSDESPDDKLVQQVFHREEVLDTVQDEVVAFMSNLLAANLPHDVIDEGRRQLRMADEYESISDYIVTVLKSHLKLENSGLKIPDSDRAELLQLHDSVTDYIRLITQGYDQRRPEVITKANSQGEAITHRVKEMRDRFVAKMSDEPVEPMVNVAFSAQLNAYRRVRDHALNVAEALAGIK
jgi:phosphate:Na+ symporter